MECLTGWGPGDVGWEVAVILKTNVSRGLRSSCGFGWRNDNSGVTLVEEVLTVEGSALNALRDDMCTALLGSTWWGCGESKTGYGLVISKVRC